MGEIIQKGRQYYLNDRPEDSGEFEVYEPTQVKQVVV